VRFRCDHTRQFRVVAADEEKALELKREMSGGQEREGGMPISRCQRRSSSSLTRIPHASGVRFKDGSLSALAPTVAGCSRSLTRSSRLKSREVKLNQRCRCKPLWT
jgi:hypothetical protein